LKFGQGTRTVKNKSNVPHEDRLEVYERDVELVVNINVALRATRGLHRDIRALHRASLLYENYLFNFSFRAQDPNPPGARRQWQR
jgi:hypothetical protein